ncbi:MAG: hypothetical protein ABR614_00410 [Mycobacteriales bacterium]
MPTRPALRVTCAALLLVLTSALPAAAADLVLPAPQARSAQEVTALCQAAGGLPDRCRPSQVPGEVRNDEVVLVGMAGDGSPARVQLEQRLVLQGVGDYAIRERGPARAAVPLTEGEDPPNTKFGAVVWQGFTPGDRRLAARLTLDAALEAARLPMAVTVTFTDAAGSRPLEPGGRIPGPGTVVVRLENRTAQPADLPTADDAPADEVAAALDAARAAADGAAGPRLPSTENGLPRTLQVTSPAQFAGEQSVPLRVTGTLRLAGTAAGPGLTPVEGGAAVDGTLTSPVELTATASGAGPFDLQLTAVPALDPRQLRPPGGAATWAAWAATEPDAAARRSALELLVQVAASGARASSYSPYLGADLPGTGSTVFRYAFAVPEKVAALREVLHPKKGPIALASLALLLLLANGALIWRES